MGSSDIHFEELSALSDIIYAEFLMFGRQRAIDKLLRLSDFTVEVAGRYVTSFESDWERRGDEVSVCDDFCLTPRLLKFYPSPGEEVGNHSCVSDRAREQLSLYYS